MSESYISQLNYITQANQGVEYFIFKCASVWRGVGWRLGVNNFENSQQNINLHLEYASIN